MEAALKITKNVLSEACHFVYSHVDEISVDERAEDNMSVGDMLCT